VKTLKVLFEDLQMRGRIGLLPYLILMCKM